MQTLYVAADIAKQSFTGAYWTEQAAVYWQSYPNDETGYAVFAAQVTQAQQQHEAAKVHLILEPTGGYELGLALFAYAQGWLVSQPNPKRLRDWANGMGYRAKTDKVDAQMLAEYGGRNQPNPQQCVPAEVRELDYYLRRLDDLKKSIQAERNRLKQAQQRPDVPRALLDQLEQSLAQLAEQKQAMGKAIKQLLKRHPRLRQRRNQLLSVPGIGPQNSLPILVLCFRFHALTSGRGTKKQIAAFLGLDARTHTSGSSIRGQAAISKQGSSVGRAYLYMGALGGIRGHNVLRNFYRRLLLRGKAKKLALVACSRKILTWAWAVFSFDTDFDPTRFPDLLTAQKQPLP